jgi:signal peptide peptidase SppA
LPKHAWALKTQLEDYLAGKIDLPAKFQSTDYTAPQRKPLKVADGIAEIDISGVIGRRFGISDDGLDLLGLVDLDVIDDQLKAARDNDAVSSIILNFNSPGGMSMGLENTTGLINSIGKEKEIVAWSDLMIASAAYEIASQANAIIVSPGARVGAIEAYMLIESYHDMLQASGVEVYLAKGGKWTAAGEPSQRLTDEQKQYFDNKATQEWEAFKSLVKSKRDVADEDMQGELFKGAALVTKGLVDGLASDIGEVRQVLMN